MTDPASPAGSITKESHHAESETTPFEGAHANPPRSRFSAAEVAVDLPELPRGEAAAPRLPKCGYYKGREVITVKGLV